MKDIKPIYILIILLVIGIGVYIYNDIQKRIISKKENCTEIGFRLGEKNRNHLRNIGHDKTDLYEDEYVYNKKLDTCLYYKSQTPILYDAESEELTISSKEIIDASINKKIISLIKILNTEEIDDEFKKPSCVSYYERLKCNTEDEFNKIKIKLFKQN